MCDSFITEIKMEANSQILSLQKYQLKGPPDTYAPTNNTSPKLYL